MARQSFSKRELAIFFVNRMPIAAVALCAATLIAAAQPTPETAPSANATRTVRISFVPPPIEGTISLGIYDQSGKLVRVLHRESDTDDFTIGHDALITEWDGKNDAGEDLPAGKYRARGFSVGALSVAGVAYFFNDWVTDDKSPHIRRLWQLWMEDKELRINADLAGDKKLDIICDAATGAVLKEAPLRMGTHCNEIPNLPHIFSPIDCASGKDETLWLIDRLGGNESREVKQLSKDHEVLRRLACPKDDPQPGCIEASRTADKIFLLEENPNLQRLRGLTLIATMTQKERTISDWNVDFEKKIVAHKDFSLENGKPVATGAKNAPEKIVQTLRPNPLKRDKPGSVEIAVGFDADGSYLKTSDGLPLRSISDTPNLSRALLTAHDEKAIDVFQDDGAVVEQFRISGADQMMAFDCGDFELK